MKGMQVVQVVRKTAGRAGESAPARAAIPSAARRCGNSACKLGIAVSLVVAGCASPPQVITQTRTVEVPVAVPCKVEPVPRPAWALDQVDPGADVFTKGRAALMEVEQRKGYESRLKAAIAACQ
ncbi:hypothetical protein P3W85_30050 [Cupriavidus basilensis]|uniref:Lipoprotein n=1 Tax=Cupriavidus basilensis TaxID=68895 RepID=A0ABT6AX18_9BURK|nr:hypothetical protein [Cupriavidus basilensis]MDF3837167.1 hypothetical protein [Cupriavidus basilensis]